MHLKFQNIGTLKMQRINVKLIVRQKIKIENQYY